MNGSRTKGKEIIDDSSCRYENVAGKRCSFWA